MSPRGESATPGRPQQNTPGGGGAPVHSRTPLATRTVTNAPPPTHTYGAAPGKATTSLHSGFKPLFAGAANNSNNKVVPPPVCPATPPSKHFNNTSSATSPSSMIKSPNSSNYACLYQRYDGAQHYYPPPTHNHHHPPAPLNFGPGAVPQQQQQHQQQQYHTQHHHVAPTTITSSILQKESKYDHGGSHDRRGGEGVAPSKHNINNNPYLVELEDNGHKECDYYSTGQSTTFSSRASSASTRCDWNQKQQKQQPITTVGGNQYQSQYRSGGGGGGTSSSWNEFGDTTTTTHNEHNNYYSQRHQQQNQAAPPPTTVAASKAPQQQHQHLHTPSSHPTPNPTTPVVVSELAASRGGGSNKGCWGSGSSSSTYGLGGVGLPAGLLQTLSGGGDNNNYHHPTTSKLSSSNKNNNLQQYHQQKGNSFVDDHKVSDASPSVAAPVEPFMSRPLWSLVGTFKTSLQTALDARKGNALRWTQSNPNGGRQRITIPFVNIASSEQIRLQVEDLQSHLADQCIGGSGGRRSRSASVESNTSRASSTTRRGGGRNNNNNSGIVTGVKRSRSESAAVARQDRLLAKLPHFANKGMGTNNYNTIPSSSFAHHPHLQQPPTTQPHRAAPRPVSMMSHAVVIKTKDMRPSQVTFGFNSSIEAALFNSKIRAIQRAAKEYVM